MNTSILTGGILRNASPNKTQVPKQGSWYSQLYNCDECAALWKKLPGRGIPYANRACGNLTHLIPPIKKSYPCIDQDSGNVLVRNGTHYIIGFINHHYEDEKPGCACDAYTLVYTSILMKDVIDWINNDTR